MKKILLFLLAVATAAVVSAPRCVHADNQVTLKAEGMALKADDTAEVKKKAIDMAIRRIIAASEADIVKAEFPSANPDVLKEKVETKARDFIVNYKIISEGWISHKEPITDADMELPDNGAYANQYGIEVFHIWIEATVDMNILKTAIANATGQVGGPTFAVSITLLDVTDYASYRSVIEAIERLNVVKELTYGSFYKGRIILNARISGGAEAFYSRLSKEVGNSLALTMASSDSLLIRGLPRAVLSE